MITKINKGFTLVELIVVITILTILSTIAYISFGNFTTGARDSSRLSDIKNIQTVLETYKLNTGIYPKPTNSKEINYSGGVVFWQGTFGEETRKQIGNRGNINNVPIDPLFKNKYSYSVQSTNRAYNLAYILEDTTQANNTLLLNKTYAAEQREVFVKVTGDFNGQVAHTSTGGKVYVFAIPSLILSDLSDTNILNSANKYVYNNENNLPASYSGIISSFGTFQFIPQIVYTGSTLPRTPNQLKDLIKNLKNAITGTYLYSKPEYRNLIELNVNDSNELYKWGKKYINQDLGGIFKLKYSKTCKEIQNSDENKGSGLYTISPNGYDKLEVYCDMNTDGGGWTRVRKWDNSLGFIEGSDITKTKGIYGTEVMITYHRYGKIKKKVGGNWITIDVNGKKYGFQYKTFKTKQTQESGLCGEHTTIADLVNQITGGSWGDCSRSCKRIDPNDANSPCDTSLEYQDIQIDDLGENIGLNNDKEINGFDDDPCIDNGYKNSYRNMSWTNNGKIQHRIDSNLTIIQLGSQSKRCQGAYWSKGRLDNQSSDWLNERGITNTSDYEQGYKDMEIWVK